jgi:hypothetical protein
MNFVVGLINRLLAHARQCAAAGVTVSENLRGLGNGGSPKIEDRP